MDQLKNDNLKKSDWDFSPVAPKREGLRVSLTPNVPQLAVRGRVEQLEKLLDEGAEVDEAAPNGASALELAAKYGQLQAVRVLLRYGAKTKHKALLAAIEAGHEEIVSCLAVQQPTNPT